MPPHLFVTRGSLLNFACDAWPLPPDRDIDVIGYWQRFLVDAVHAVRPVKGAIDA
jgi:hypothetical protein